MRSIAVLALLTLGILPPSAAKAGSVYRCDFAGVRETSLPLHPERKGSPWFRYRYQVLGDLASGRAPIVFLPGGPGSSAIRDYSRPEAVAAMVEAHALPADHPWILFDPRTTGCNRGDASVFPDDSLTSWLLAGDVLAVLRELRVREYVLYGHSYGSQWATFVAARASSGEGPEPKAVMLSGVLGMGRGDGSFAVHRRMAEQWEALKATLSPRAREILDSDAPLGHGAEEWGPLVSDGLYDGFLVREGRFSNRLKELLAGLDSEDPVALQPLLDALGEGGGQDQETDRDFSQRLYDKIDCHEFSPDDKEEVVFSRGRLVADPEDHSCEGETFDRPYDSASLRTRASIYYLAGTADPAAPFVGALHHFEHQTLATRSFVKVPGGGHDPWGAIFPDCRGRIWDAVFHARPLGAELGGCAAPVEVSVRAPGT